MPYYNWNEIASTPMSPMVARQQINGDRMSVLRISLQKDGVVAIHQHPNEQISVLVSGKVEFNLNGEKRVLLPGDVVIVADNLPHGVTALEDSEIVESFNPPRYDLMPKA